MDGIHRQNYSVGVFFREIGASNFEKYMADDL